MNCDDSFEELIEALNQTDWLGPGVANSPTESMMVDPTDIEFNTNDVVDTLCAFEMEAEDRVAEAVPPQSKGMTSPLTSNQPREGG